MTLQTGAVHTEAVAGDSPIDAAVPFWVTACVRLMPPRRRNGAEITASLANAVFPAVQALIADRLRAEGEADAPLNRDRIARRCGLGDAKKAIWLFDYLEQIRFLRVHRHYAAPGRGRAVDTFTVFTRPPLNYVGPRTHAELERALDHPDRLLTCVLFVSETAGQGEGSRSGTVRADQGAESGTLVSETAGQGEGSRSGTVRADQGAESGTLVSETAGQGEGSRSGTLSDREREGTPSREFPPSIDRGAAPPGVAGPGGAPSSTAMAVVARSPWPTGQRPNRGQSVELGLLVEAALQDHGLSEAEVQEYVVATLQRRAKDEQRKPGRKSNPARYVANALAPDNLPIPTPSDAIELPQDDGLAPDVDLAQEAPAATQPVSALPACDECGAEAGAPLVQRVVENPDGGRDLPCSVCRPSRSVDAA
jgi:hypothetical protein